MSAYKPNPLLDAATVLVGWTNRSATRDTEKLFASGEVVRLNTKLDATLHFTLMVSHPGHSVAVETQLELAPVLRDGTMGTFVGVATVAIPAEGGRVEAYISKDARRRRAHGPILDADVRTGRGMRWVCAGLGANPSPTAGAAGCPAQGPPSRNRQAVAVSRLAEEPAASTRSLGW